MELSNIVRIISAIIGSSAFVIVGWVLVGLTIVVAISVVKKKQKNTSKSNDDKMVEEILKTKRGKIKNAPLPPGGPDWKEILKMKLREIKNKARKNIKGYKEIYKLLTDGRFNK